MNSLEQIHKTLSSEVFKNNILAFEEELMKYEQLEIEPEHLFADGLYCRTLKMPKGSILTSKFHKYQNITIITEGSAIVSMCDGVKRIDAPYRCISPAGAKRALYIIEDCTWTTIHNIPGWIKTVEEVENYLTVTSFEELETFKNLLEVKQ